MQGNQAVQLDLFGKAPTPPPTKAEPAPEPAPRKKSPEERAFGHAAWLWVPGAQLIVHWNGDGFRLPDGSPWRAPKRLEPKWWARIDEASAEAVYAAVTKTTDPCVVYRFKQSGGLSSVQFGGGAGIEVPDEAPGRHGHWSCHLDGGGWACVEGRRVLVLDSMSIYSCGHGFGQGVSLVRFADAGKERIAWAKPEWLRERLGNADSWTEIADDLRFLTTPPSVEGFQEQATAAWIALREAVPGYTDLGVEDAAWRCQARDGVVWLRHKPTGREVAVAQPSSTLTHDVHRYVDGFRHEVLKAPDAGDAPSPRHATPQPIQAWLDKLEDTLAWCRAPEPGSWKLVGLPLWWMVGCNTDAWTRALDLLKDLEEENPEEGTPLHACLERCRRLVSGASWDVPGLLAARDTRYLQAASGLLGKPRSPRRSRTRCDDSEE